MLGVVGESWNLQLKNNFSNRVGKNLSEETFFSGVLKSFESVKAFNAQAEDCRQTLFDRIVAWFILTLK